jgi:Xaa-Pro aminopeptidase
MYRGRDDERIARMKDQMRAAGLDYLVLRLPENVLYATGYWPIFGASMAVVPLEGEATIFFVEGEQEFVADSWVKDARAYKFFDLELLASPTRDFARMLKDLWNEKGYDWKATIGYEASFELIGANNVSAEARVPAESSNQMLRELFADAKLVDGSDAVRKARIVKSKMEIDLIRTACDITGLGYAAGRDLMIPGVTEAEVSGAVEGRIYGKGVGYNGVRRARGYCFAMSGPNSAISWRPFCIASDRQLQRGDVVLLELDAFADGYFIDLTRTMSVGEPTPRAQEIWGIINESVDAALKIVKPGVPARELNRVAQQVIIDRGYGAHFVHHVGHGVGLQFHEPPTLHPQSKELLEKGMTFAVEPAIYIQGWGGIRIEENVVVTENGYEMLSLYPRGL